MRGLTDFLLHRVQWLGECGPDCSGKPRLQRAWNEKRVLAEEGEGRCAAIGYFFKSRIKYGQCNELLGE